MDSVIDSILQDLLVLGKVRAKCKRFSEKFGVRQFYTQVFLEADGSAVYKACFEAPVGHPLLCPVDGCMTVTWYRNERRLLEAERVSLVKDGNFWCADVAAVSVDDAGRWTCTAENAGGRASCSAHLNVLVPKAYKRPEFVEELRAILTEQGTVSLECKVVGVPTPVLRWFKDSREIKAGDVFALTANAEDPTSLGTYTCEAVNCMGRAYSSSKVHVMGRAGDGSRPASSLSLDPPPIFTTELAQQHAKICEPLTLAVQLVVPPWPRSVVWYNKEGKIENGDRYHVLEDGVGGYMLEIPSAEYPDEGEWKCVATTSGGRVGISSCYVTMDVPKNYRKPRFMENLQAVLTEEGLVSFECKVVGFPTPVLSWFKDGQELKPGDVYQLTGTNSLGSYCCIARNCMGQARSSAELTVEDIQNQLNEEEKLHLFSKNQAPNFITGLKSVEAKIDEPFRFTVKVAIPPEPSVLWYRDDQPVDESSRNHLGTEEKGIFFLDIQNLEFLDQAEWKCVAMNDFGHSVTSCFLKLIIPRHYKKPRFLENLQAILSEEGAVNLECKVIGVPQPVLKWYKDGEELKSGDIHRIISGQDGTCCLGTYTCEAQNCMGIAASSASLLGFEDSMKAKAKKLEEQALQRNLSLSTIHEERTSQMYDTPVGDITLDEKGEISFSFDGKEVSVSLYETPDLTEEEALQIVEMYADQLSENVTEHNVVELPPLRFVKETSTSGNLLMEAIIIDVSPEYFASTEEDLRTEADVEDISIADENGPPQLSLDTDIGGEDYLEKTMALLSDEKSDLPKKSLRKKSDSQRSVEDYFSLSRDQSFSEEKRDDDTQVISETELMSFASARSSTKQKSRTSKQSFEEAHDLAEIPKPMEFKEESQKRPLESDSPVTPRPKRERRTSRSSRRSSSGSEKSFSKLKAEEAREQITAIESLAKESMLLPTITDEEFRNKTTLMSTLLSKVINDVQIVERDIILKSELMSSAATASRSLEIISNLITPLSEIQSVSDAIKDLAADVKDLSSSMFNRLPPSLKNLQQSLAMIEKCIEVESDSKTLVKKTCVAFIETCGEDMQQLLKEMKSITKTRYLNLDEKAVSEIEMLAGEMTTVLKLSADTIKTKQLLSEASEIKIDEPTFEAKHLRDTQKAVFELRSPVNSLLCIAESAETGKIIDVSKVKTSDIIMNDMSASIQDLQTALEQIESLSVKESTTALHKYNTEIIETVMESVLKLRSSFELLSTETRTEENKDVLKQTLTSIKQNLSEISSHIDTIEKNVGPLDILQSDNKLEVLQKMAQILIALENNLPNFETLPEIKNHMDIFHKNLTKVLENVIESNDGKKYFALLQICDAVNRMNTSIKTIDTDILLSLASLSNTVKIIQDHIISNVFQSELNCAMLSNIADILVGIQEAINHAEEISINVDSEHLQDLSIKEFEINKANVIVEHINQTICAITNVKSMEATAELKTAIAPTLESICPILEELKRYVATSRVEKTEMEHVSAMSDLSMAETLAAPLCELNQNIIILNQMIMENIEHIKDSGEIVSTIAEPLHELHITLEVLQQDVISQYGEELTPYEVSVNMASAVQNLQSCILMIQDQAGIEGIDEMSTLEDVSGLKTTADTIPEEFLFASSVAETPVEQGLVSMDESLPLSETAQELNILNEHLTILKTPEILDALDTLSEVSDYSSLKSVAVGLGELYSGIEEILQPIVMESSTELSNLINPSKLTSIAVPMQELQQYLSVLDINNIPIYEHILEMPIEKIHSVFQSITQFKAQLEKCLQVIFPAMENADKDVETVHKVECLREVCENMKETIESTTLANEHKETLESLGTCVQNLLQATETSNELKMEKVKCIAQELYDKIQNAEEDMIQFTPMTPEKLAQEAKLFQSVSEVEKNIAVLEQFDFVDVSKVSDITPCTTPQLAMELEVDSLLQIDDVVENAVNVLQNSVKEMPVADLMIVEDFFKTCKNEFTILRCLVAKPVSHKKLIRILQEFTNLQISINDFKIKCLDLNLTEEIKNNLVTFMIHADDCLKNVQESLIRIIDSQSELLFKKPAVKLDNNIKKLHASIKEEKEFVVKNIVEHFIALSEIAIISVENIDRVIKDELTNPNSIQTKPEERKLVQYVEDLEIFLENEIRSQSVDSPNKKMLSELLDCLHKHQDYKDAIGSGKSLIIIKCLAECSEILQLKVLKSTLTQETVEEMEIKEGILKTILTEMLAPLQAFQSQIKNIQQKIVSDPHDESASLDISTTESFVHTMTEIHKEFAQIEQNISEGSAVNNEDISLLMEVDKEIHTIQDSIKAIDNTPSAEKVREISKPIEDIEKTLHSILSSELARTESKDKLVTAESADLSQVLEKYVSSEIVQALEEISTVIEVNELKQSIELARELKDNIATINSETKSEIIEKAINTQIILEQELQNALSVVQVQAIQNTEKLCNVVDATELKKVNDLVAELQAEVSYAIMISPELKISNAADEHLEISPADIIPEASTQVFEEVKSETNLICDLEVETSKKESVETTTVTQEGEIAEVVETVALTEDITEQHITPETVAVIQEIEPVIVEEVVSSMMPVLKSEDINENVEVPARPIAENIPNIEDTSKSDTLINQQASNSEIETRSMQSLDNLAESEATVEYTDTVKQSMETLQKHLQNYTSDITQLLTEACDESNMKEIKQSLIFAQELYSENVIGEPLEFLSFQNLPVAQKLYTALSVVLNQLSESVQCLENDIGINNVQIIKADAAQLIDSLASIIAPINSVECQQLSENMNKTVIPQIENIQQKPEIAISNLKTAQSVDNSLNFVICENIEENLIHEEAAPAIVEVFEADDNHSAILLGKSEIEYIDPIEIDTFHDQISDLIEPEYETTINTADGIKNDLIVQSDKNEFGVTVDHQNILINNVEEILSQNLQEYSDQNENISSVENLQECSHKNEFPVDINIGEICKKPIDELEKRFDNFKQTQGTEAGNKTDDFTKIENASVEIGERPPAHSILGDSKLHQLSYEKDETTELIESNEKSVEVESINNSTKQIILLPEQEFSSLTTANEIITEDFIDKKIPMSSVGKSPVVTKEEDNDIINENTTLNCTIETTEKCDALKTEEVMDKSIVTLLQHIDDFVSSEITDVVDELSKTVQDKQITETFAIARELREKIEASEIINVSELNGELSESLKVAQAQQEALAQQLQSSLEVLQEYALNSADEIISSVSLDSLKKVSDAVIHLQDDLISANIVQIKQEFMPLQSLPDKSEDTASVQSEGENTIQRLDGLLQEVSDKIDLSSTDKNSENTESLRDSLDEVQTVIIKLRRDYDGIENESLNETLEDLECSVRSVQLQINEDSPPELLKEACATLQLLVNNIHETQEVQFIETLTKGVNKTDKMLEKCSDETQETVDLLETATVLDVKDSSQLGNIISNINFLRETLKSLRLSFLGNAESLIEKGIEVNLNLEQIEEKVFSLEKDLASEESIKTETKERINSAIHAIFGSISNMRSTILSIQKQYMYENYGKPSENLLKSVKIVSNFGKTEDNVELKRKWKNLSVSLRNVIIHFEDIKFYVNLDKTARIPSDSGLTKCVLDELKSNITEAIRPLTKCIEENTIEKIDHLIHCLATNILNIDSRSTLEVKEKIPIFKNIASQILDVTETLQNELQSLKEKGVPLVESTNISELDKTDTINNTQQSNTLDIKESNASVENLSSDMVKAETSDIDKDTEDLLCISSDTKDLTVFEKETKTPSDATLGHTESKLIKAEESITNEKDENYLSQANDEKEGIEEVPQVEDVIQKIEKLESVPSTSKVLESVIDSNIKEITNVNDESIMTDIETSLLTTEEQSNIGEIKSDEIADMEKVLPAEVTIEKSESVPSTSKILETDIESDIKEITNVKDENNMADLETTLNTGEIKNDEIVGIEKESEAEVTEEKIEKSEPVLTTSQILETDIESDINEIKNEKDEKNMVDLKTSLLTIEEQSNIGDIKNDETAGMEKTSQAEDAMVKLEKTESVPTSSKILATDIEIDSKEFNINVKHENNMADLETSILTREDQSNIGEEKNDLEKSISIIKDDNAPSDKPVEVLPSTSKITEVPVSVIKSDMLSIDPKLTESINEDLESEPPKKEQLELIEEEKRECHTEQANKELSEPIEIVLNEHTNVALAGDIVPSSSQSSEENMKSSNIDEEQRFGVIESETNERILRTDDNKEEIGEESINENIIKQKQM
ncbi:unnamed protein product [Plutella xylostella]|uniref:(diamondback moth) hypothetical protein n=1 Tax=Plutella xylostella TaxID=51655 RepID=A0A8S4GC57_PLUXY|nr:unnamed protein product [Plutella xylostella]